MERNPPAGWTIVRLSDLVDPRGITYGVVQPGRPVENGTPVIRVTNFSHGRLLLDDVLRIDSEIAGRYERSRLVGGEVLITLVGSVGQVAVAPADAAGWNVARAVGVIPVRRDESAAWVATCLRSPLTLARLSTHFNTTVQTTLNLKDLAACEVPMPPVREREAIIDVLGALDEKIECNGRLSNAGLAVLASSFADLTVRVEGRVALAEVANAVKAPTAPARMPDEVFEQFSIPAFDLGLGPDVCLGSSMASAKTVMPDDVVLLSKLNPATKRVWWPERLGIGRAVCSPEFVGLAPAGVPATWIYGSLAFDPVFYGQVLGAVTGTTGSRQRVKPSDVLAATVPAASDDQVAKWDAFARPLLDQNVALLREMRTLGAIRDALLPKLVSGQIRVPLSDDVEEQIGPATESLA